MITPTHSQPRTPVANEGYILLISVLITGAIAASIAVALLTSGTGFLQSTGAAERSIQARGIADACVEEAIYQLQKDNAYVGPTTLTFTAGTCTVETVLGTGDTDRTIQVRSTVLDVVRKMSVVVATVVPPAQISSWQDVADF